MPSPGDYVSLHSTHLLCPASPRQYYHGLSVLRTRTLIKNASRRLGCCATPSLHLLVSLPPACPTKRSFATAASLDAGLYEYVAWAVFGLISLAVAVEAICTGRLPLRLPRTIGSHLPCAVFVLGAVVMDGEERPRTSSAMPLHPSQLACCLLFLPHIRSTMTVVAMTAATVK